MNYRQLLLLLAILLTTVSATPQEIGVKSFELLPDDKDARVNQPVEDQNGDKCALIKVVTDQQGFVWEAGIPGIQEIEKKSGEYWVYVPNSAEKITIRHENLGVLKDYVYPEDLKEASVYEMKLTTGESETAVEDPGISTVWVRINSVPKNADVYVDEDYLGQTPLYKKIKVGEHNYRIAKKLYSSETGVINLKEGQDRENLNITLNANYGTLSIDSKPEQGAKVYIDGEETNKTTPCTIEKIAAGAHTVTLRKKLYEPKSEKLTIEVGQEITRDIEMEPSYGEISIETEPSAQIYQEGEKIGTDTVHKRLTPDVYSFKAEKDKHHSAKETVEIQKGDAREISLTLEPKYGTLEVTTEPGEAIIRLNGENYGKTPKTIKELLIGEYKMTLEKEGYRSVSKTIELEENKDTAFHEELQEASTYGKDITIRSNPSGGYVTIDGEEYGKAPVLARIPSGPHEIEIEKGKYITKKTFKVKETDKRNYNFSLRLKNKFYVSYSGSIFPNNPKYIAPYGIQIGMLGKWGWYISCRLNETYLEPDVYEYDGEKALNYPADKYYEMADKRNYPLFSVSGGLSFNLGKNFHLYIGGGYGTKEVYRHIDEFSYSNDEKLGDAFLSDNNYSINSFELEGGFMFHARPFVFNVGYKILKFKYSSVMFGVGIAF